MNSCMPKKLIFIFLLISTSSLAKIDSLIKPQMRFSPTQIANLKINASQYIKCTYGQPLKKGRIVFGNLVPFNQLWRTGANEATELTVTSDFEIGSKQMKAGTYSLFTIPKEDKWTVILNSDLGLWGAFDYDSTKNVFAEDFASSKTENDFEGFTISFEDRKEGTVMLMAWEQTLLVVPIKLIAKIEDEPKSKKKRKRRK